jgi:hypothetical protein
LVAPLISHSHGRHPLHCAANRRPEHIEHETVSEVLSAIALVDIENGDLTTAPCCQGACARLPSSGSSICPSIRRSPSSASSRAARQPGPCN